MHYHDGLTRDSYGKRTDKTRERDLTFSEWHRRYLSNKCYATDIDFFEYRIIGGKISPRAFLEVKQAHVRQERYIKTANNRAILTIAQKLQIKFIIVLYELIDEETLECDFYVWEVRSLEELDSYREREFSRFFKRYSHREFIDFLENL